MALCVKLVKFSEGFFREGVAISGVLCSILFVQNISTFYVMFSVNPSICILAMTVCINGIKGVQSTGIHRVGEPKCDFLDQRQPRKAVITKDKARSV